MKNILPRKPRLLLYGLACFLPRASSRQTTTSNATLACNQAQSILGDSTVQTPSDSDYAGASTAPWNLFNTQFKPACVVLPRNNTDVQVAMRSIFQFDVDYAVQAGGHSAMKGWNNVNNGVLISFERMDNISYDAAKDTITFEPAIRWGEIVATLESQGVAPVGGRIDDVGTGLLLGGGLSFLSPAHGFAADNYVELDIVLVDGTLVTATETNNYSDLFRALKGGANRFGIYPNSSFDAVAQAVFHYVRDVEDPNAALLLYFGALVLPDGTLTSFSIANMFYNGNSLPNSTYGELLSIPSISQSLGPLSWPELVASMAEPQPANGHGQLFGASVLAAGEDHDDLSFIDIVHKWQNFTFTFQSQINSTVLAFTPVPVSQITVGKERGGNAIDPPLIPYSAIQFQLTLPLGVPTISSEMEEGRQLFFQEAPRSPGFPLYMNECDVKQSVFETYGQYEFLKQTYMKYDPTRFNVRHTNGPQGL
ncbi:FAD-binding domain-containing protein [Dendrothele bispora CBS 962.96]|uniref:FAD-binding domain-containing protein n=1 Tax=Dendrothele bispora (strain CBS 962.96) TaxID=1314807 RepID=A0A4S8MMP5_DENBC|nr:FAD-binding domain-containing protein [Dendrothele bispora CBS 962.96]